MDVAYDGRQVVGMDLHRRRSVLVRMTEDGQRPLVVLEATYGWYWAADVLEQAGAEVRLAHPLGVKAFSYRRVKNDLLTELTDRSLRWCVRRRAMLARFRPRDQRRGRAAGVLRVGGAAARLA